METTYKEQAKKTMYQQNENINREIIKGTKQKFWSRSTITEIKKSLEKLNSII